MIANGWTEAFVRLHAGVATAQDYNYCFNHCKKCLNMPEFLFYYNKGKPVRAIGRATLNH